jgi:DNA polymerase III psi subunit
MADCDEGEQEFSCLDELPSPAIVGSMTANEFAALSFDHLRRFTPEHVRCLKDEHLKALNDNVLCEVWTATQLNALSSSQAAVLARMIYSE